MSSPSALAPLVTTTASLGYAIAEFAFIPALVRAKTISSESIGAFWNYSVLPATVPVVAFNGTSTVLGAILWRRLPEGSFGRLLVGWGTLAAAGHFIFGYKIAQIIQNMVYQPATARHDLKRWLKVHAIRTLTTDIPAFACFFAAVYYGV